LTSRVRAGGHSAFAGVALSLAMAAWIYAAALVVCFKVLDLAGASLDGLAEWAAVPLQAGALLLSFWLIVRDGFGERLERAAWLCILAFVAVNIVANIVWNTTGARTREELGFPDFLYLLDYGLLTGGFVCWFLLGGGSFRRRSAWIDLLTMTTVPLVGLWSFFLDASIDRGIGQLISWPATLGYSVALVGIMSMGALLCLQVRARAAAVYLVVAAAVADAAWELMWLASWLTGQDFVGRFYNYGDVLCFALIISAIAVMSWRRGLPDKPPDSEWRLNGFLPALSVLTAIALVAGSLASMRKAEGWILVGLVGLSAILLITRQRSVRAELAALNRELADKHADERLTELVRRSTDLILVVGENGTVRYASPATISLLGKLPNHIQGTAWSRIFGPAHAAILEDFFERVNSEPRAQAGAEIETRCGAKRRFFKINAVNQLANDLINGVLVTIADVSEQRLLEREVLEAASRERLRLSAQIHDGLGQELVGVSMLLKAVTGAREMDVGVMKARIETAITHINGAIGAARDLARGLSPLAVVRGSLGNALGRLVPDPTRSVPVHLEIDPAFDDRAIDDLSADHLYWIAQEAICNALRHSNCSSIRVSLGIRQGVLHLAVDDDGQGLPDLSADHPGLGLRLMGYRARMIGGSLQIEPARSRGTRLEVTLPLQADRRACREA
jgi:PAS domain S-box-containing protein